MQCAKYLDGHRDWRQVSLLNTALAAEKVAQDADKTQAAIASPWLRSSGDLRCWRRASTTAGRTAPVF